MALPLICVTPGPGVSTTHFLSSSIPVAVNTDMSYQGLVIVSSNAKFLDFQLDVNWDQLYSSILNTFNHVFVYKIMAPKNSDIQKELENVTR